MWSSHERYSQPKWDSRWRFWNVQSWSSHSLRHMSLHASLCVSFVIVCARHSCVSFAMNVIRCVWWSGCNTHTWSIHRLKQPLLARLPLPSSLCLHLSTSQYLSSTLYPMYLVSSAISTQSSRFFTVSPTSHASSHGLLSLYPDPQQPFGLGCWHSCAICLSDFPFGICSCCFMTAMRLIAVPSFHFPLRLLLWCCRQLLCIRIIAGWSLLCFFLFRFRHLALFSLPHATYRQVRYSTQQQAPYLAASSPVCNPQSLTAPVSRFGTGTVLTITVLFFLLTCRWEYHMEFYPTSTVSRRSAYMCVLFALHITIGRCLSSSFCSSVLPQHTVCFSYMLFFVYSDNMYCLSPSLLFTDIFRLLHTLRPAHNMHA